MWQGLSNISACWNYGLFCFFILPEKHPQVGPRTSAMLFLGVEKHISSADATLQSSHDRMLKPINGRWAKPDPFVTFKIQNTFL